MTQGRLTKTGRRRRAGRLTISSLLELYQPGKADAKTGKRRRVGRLTMKVRRSFDDPGKVDEKLGGAEEQVG